MLSQIEMGRSSPTIALGWKIANGLGVPFGALLGEPMPGDFVIHRSEQAQILYSEGKTLCSRALFPAGDPRVAEMYELTLEPGMEERATFPARASSCMSHRGSCSSRRRAMKRRCKPAMCCSSVRIDRTATTIPVTSRCAAFC